MDKVTRVLILYSRLINGETINKLAFCEEFEYNGRSFDRDIEDVRLFLSEIYSAKELIYDRPSNCYYLSGSKRVELESVEYSVIERVMVDSEVLRRDELSELLSHLAANTENYSLLKNTAAQLLNTYREPEHGRALLKIYSDLTVVIRNKSVIKLKYSSADEYVYREVIPCYLFYRDKHFYLTAFDESSKNYEHQTFRLDMIESFEILRRQTANEQIMITTFNKNN